MGWLGAGVGGAEGIDIGCTMVTFCPGLGKFGVGAAARSVAILGIGPDITTGVARRCGGLTGNCMPCGMRGLGPLGN